MQYVNSSNEIALGDIFKAIWNNKTPIFVLTSIIAMLFIVYAIMLPNKYQSKVITLPTESEDVGGLSSLANQFGGLASIAGMNLNGGAGNITKTLEILKSKAFLMEFIDKYELKVPLFAVNSWNHETGEYQFDKDIYDVTSKKWIREVDFPRVAEPSLLESYHKMTLEYLNISHDPKTNIVEVTFTHYSPRLAQRVVTDLVRELNIRIRKIEVENAEKSIKYLNNMVKETKVSGLREVFFSLIEQEEKKRMLANIQDEYALEVLDPALIPEEKSSPKRAAIAASGVILGFLFSTFLLFFINWFRQNISVEK